MTELALNKKLAENSKEFDDLVARFEAMRASQGATENRIRDEVARIQQENLKLHVQVEQAHAEVAKLGRVIGDRENIIMQQKCQIDELEKSKTPDALMRGPSYIL